MPPYCTARVNGLILGGIQSLFSLTSPGCSSTNLCRCVSALSPSPASDAADCTSPFFAGESILPTNHTSLGPLQSCHSHEAAFSLRRTGMILQSACAVTMPSSVHCPPPTPFEAAAYPEVTASAVDTRHPPSLTSLTENQARCRARLPHTKRWEFQAPSESLRPQACSTHEASACHAT